MSWCMRFLRNPYPPIRFSLLSLPPRPTTPRCSAAFVRTMVSESPKPWGTRCILIKNLPSTFDIAKLLGLRGLGRHIESVIRRPESNECEIRYLQNAGALLVVNASERGLVMDGQKLEVKLLAPQTLPVEIIAAVALRSAHRTLWLRPPEQFKTEIALEQELKRFGKVEIIWIDESKGRAQVTFADIRTAIKAWKSLRSEKAWEGCGVAFRIISGHILPHEEDFTSQDHPSNVLLSPISDLYQLSETLKDILVWKDGEPLISFHLQSNTAFLKFRNTILAKRFYDACKPPGNILKKWNYKRVPRDTNRINASKLGATRTLILTDLNDTRIESSRLHEDFSKFGSLIKTEVDWPR
ncbi:hypothetical protein D9758_005796 [Tetrapyrgos nigripes]|uniref:RRM domain-containing protein n=1 Tax=Tetrapyrgos nigripes TaxID=182062 RepID=A0A8H5LQI9_9AGAR|nr:hypothetical protein D9758_005796 [Tetrapyrgos nigripes]